MNVTSVTGGLYVGCYIWWQGGDNNYNYLEGFVSCYLDNLSVTPSFIWDSNEDFFESGFYFWAGKQNTKELGCPFKNDVSAVAAYRFNDNDPIPFNSTFRIDWKNGNPGSIPTLNPTQVVGVLWYYEAEAP
jgi:hypothetical protein